MSKIEWTDCTWNPVRGCSRISPGCVNCYAERMAARFSKPGMWGHGFARMTPSGPRWTGAMALVPEKLREPLHWRKPRRVFVNSESDLFHEALSDEAIARVLSVMASCGHHGHAFQILTKRPQRMRRWFEEQGNRLMVSRWFKGNHLQCVEPEVVAPIVPWPLPNLWLGVSVEDQQRADERIPLLLQTPAAVRFVSYEPALELVDFREACARSAELGGPWHYDNFKPTYHERKGRVGDALSLLDWVIVGGESGPGTRPFDVAWARSVRDQCRAAGVAFFYKQGGASNRCEHSAKGGCLDCAPADLRVREFPRC